MADSKVLWVSGDRVLSSWSLHKGAQLIDVLLTFTSQDIRIHDDRRMTSARQATRRRRNV
jgi:hypothetical protein